LAVVDYWLAKDNLLRNSRWRSLFETRAGARIELAVMFEACNRMLILG